MDHKSVNDRDQTHPIETNQTGIDGPQLDQRYREETASELVDQRVERTHDEHTDEIQSMYGWIAIALSVLSFFWIPILFAGAGIILGFIARNRHVTLLGNTAIIIGIISILGRLFILPLI